MIVNGGHYMPTLGVINGAVTRISNLDSVVTRKCQSGVCNGGTDTSEKRGKLIHDSCLIVY